MVVSKTDFNFKLVQKKMFGIRFLLVSNILFVCCFAQCDQMVIYCNACEYYSSSGYKNSNQDSQLLHNVELGTIIRAPPRQATCTQGKVKDSRGICRKIF